jgi:N-acetylglucosamine-6-phosphate deacetylase
MRSIDVHTHGIGGFDTRSSTVDDILKISEIHGALGVSEIVLSIYPAPIPNMRQQVELVRRAMELQGPGSGVRGPVKTSYGNGRSDDTDPPTVTRRELQSLASAGPGNTRKRVPDPGPRAQARILGVHLEGPFLNPSQCGALDPAFFIDPEERAFRELVDGLEGIIKIVTVAPERPAAPEFIRKATELGIIVSMGHSNATYAEAEAGFRAGARGITHLFNCMRAFHHREPGLAGFGLSNSEIYVEFIADPFHLHVGAIDLIFKAKKPDRIILVSDSVRETGTRGDGRIADGSGRLQGGSVALVESARRLVGLGFEESAVTNTISVNPHQYLMLNS